MLFSREQKRSGHTSTLFLGGEGEVSLVNWALEGSILKLYTQRAFFLTFLSKIAAGIHWKEIYQLADSIVHIWNRKSLVYRTEDHQLAIDPQG